MAFLTQEIEYDMKAVEMDYQDECIGCETGVDFMGAHQLDCGRYYPNCCTRAAELEREKEKEKNNTKKMG